ncbi:MAG: hypothetical protein JOZ38_08105 [Candidatus Eremiobacteraeota bacterium]|nr:hypothetical protein [Candidatus Eremiobacteraeota bacterium]
MTFAEIFAPARLSESPTAVPEPERPPCPCAATLAELRRMRASMSEALERAVTALLTDIAASVLARELRLAPADVRCIVSQLLEQFSMEEPACVRVCPTDAPLLEGFALPVRVDASLRHGDAVLEVRNGSIESLLGMRLASALSASVDP